MDIEAVVARRMSAAAGVPGYVDVPKGTPGELIAVTQVSGGGTYMEPTRVDVDCCAAKRKRARAIADAVRAAVPALEDEPNVFHPTVEAFYRSPDPDTGRPRYVVGIQVWICE